MKALFNKKILILGDVNSSHIIKWASSLSLSGLEIGIFTLTEPKEKWYMGYPGIRIFHSTAFDSKIVNSTGFVKLNYLKVIGSLKKIISEYKPNIVHAHYASSYGLLGALVNFHPYVISVWGSDIFEFPNKSFLHRSLIKYNLRKADRILSTSHIMARRTTSYTKNQIQVIPFGIDTTQFQPSRKRFLFKEDDLVIGTIKALEKDYGIDYLVEAFDLLVKKYPALPLKLMIAGDGTLRNQLTKLVDDKGLSQVVVFTGKIPFNKVVDYFNELDVFVALSINESFGVAILEASACAVPVVVSDAGGLPEVVQNGKTGLIVQRCNAQAAANAIEKLIADKDLREQYGQNGRKWVEQNFLFSKNVEQLISVYQTLSL